MTSELEQIFGELGIPQYLDVFIEQGFDTWDTILDITESDLDALGVKLGHRRKLQRRIANSRGHGPEVSLISPPQPSIEDPRLDGPDPARSYPKDATVVTKRKYRRHPKSDDNAPERPPSAYVLFSNKMREDLKSQNLTFTEIAKLVGEKWQALSPMQKDVYESQATKAKDKYNHDLAIYKKTPDYRKYSQYLQEFKQKQAQLSQAKDASKRLKLEEMSRSSNASSASKDAPKRLKLESTTRNMHGSGGGGSSSSKGATPGSRSGSGDGSGSDSPRASVPPSTRKQRVSSNVSMPDSQYNSSTAPTPISQAMSIDDSIPSPTMTVANASTGFYPDQTHHHQSKVSSRSPRGSHQHHPQGPPSHSWSNGTGDSINGHGPDPYRTSRASSSSGMGSPDSTVITHRALPSLSNMLHDGSGRPQHPSELSRSPDSAEYRGFPSNGLPGRHGPSPPLVEGKPPHPPPLRHESSTGGSTRTTSTASSDFAYPRTPSSSDGSLPIRIDALLSTKSYFSPVPPPPAPTAAPAQQQQRPYHHLNGSINGFHSPPSSASPSSLPKFSPMEMSPDGKDMMQNPLDRQGLRGDGSQGLDGMSALLRAGEIVDRRAK